MPQFPMTESRRKALERIPDYAVAISPALMTVTVKQGDSIIAKSDNAFLIQETRHDDVYYLPRSDVDMNAFEATELSTYCPFKGHANYWSLPDLENFAWSYEGPYPEVAELKDYVSFYTSKVEVKAG
jgi:uncharacterized protein (DUF427 family)